MEDTLRTKLELVEERLGSRDKKNPIPKTSIESGKRATCRRETDSNEKWRFLLAVFDSLPGW